VSNKTAWETVMPRMPSPPRTPLEAGACDTHTHVFGPFDQFPVTHAPSYALPMASAPVHASMLARIGATRSVLVQPAPYGSDPSALLSGLRLSRGQARGVAVTSHDIDDRTLQAWHNEGVRGLRFCEVVDSGTGKPFAGSVGIEHLRTLAPRIKSLGWHAQVWAPASRVASIAHEFLATGVPLVFEHMASVSIQDGLGAPAFQAVLELVKESAIWLKLDVCRVSRLLPDYGDVRPFHQALIEANPGMLLWASDWPFVRMGDAAPDVGHLLDLFEAWVPDHTVRHAILVANPTALYGFEPMAAR
jgi:predicted TIM-barrel fold metal-dependent hydrolase